MHFDALTLACVTDELGNTLAGGRIQQILAPDEQSIGLEVYAGRQRHYLLLVAGGPAPRIHLSSQKLRRGVEQPSPLLLLLRKYVRNSLLERIEQPDAGERLIRLHFDHPEYGTTTLVGEMLGQRSNLILVRPDGRIFDCLRRVWPGDGPGRLLAPGQLYTAPPPQEKALPVDDGSPGYYERLHTIPAQSGKLWQALVKGVAGVSPTIGREIAWRVTGNSEAAAEDADLLAVVAALQSLWAPVQTGEWQPGVWQEEGEVVGFSAYEAHIRGVFTPVESISMALERFYAQPMPAQTAPDAYSGLRNTVAAALRRAEQRIQRQLTALAGDEPPPGAADTLRTQAEWLLALHHQVEPGQAVLAVKLEEETLHIPLDPERTPVEQAGQMFKRAGRMERAARIIPERRAKLQADLDFLAQLRVDLELAENQPEIAAVREEVQKAGLLPRSQKKTPRQPGQAATTQPRRYLSPEGFAILVGRNARQNERVTFELAGSSDLWLHVRGAPGSHVVIRNGGQPVPDETLHFAAQLAAYYSSLRGEHAAVVSYTERRNISRAAGGRTGQVLLRNERTVTVRGELPEENVERRT
jgi:predicted ribosome quality control (RQC) complex YloA/Tae2 family protein